MLFAKSNAQTTDAKFKHLSLQDGLSQSVVLDIIQDSIGFLWIATQDGLNRFDGKEFQTFKYSPNDSNSIKGNWINTLALGNNSTLWIGTYRSGLGKLNLKTYKYTSVPLDTFQSKRKFAIGKIIPFENFLFVSTYGNGFFIIDLQKNQIKKFQHNPQNPNSLSGNFIRSMLLDKNKILWLGTTKGLDKYDIQKEKFTHYFENDDKKLAENFIVTLLEDSNNNLWIGTRKGLNIYNQTTRQLFEYTSSPKLKGTLSDKTVITIWEDSYGYVWVGTWKGGLNKTKVPVSSASFNYNKIKFDNFQKKDDDNFSLSGNYVRKIFEDKSKNLWIGTWGSSLNKLNLKPKKFYSVGSNKKEKLHLNNSFVRSFTIDKFGRLWVGTDGGGLNILNAKKNKFMNYSFGKKKNKSIGKDRIYSLLTLNNNEIWIGLGDGLVIWHSKENKFQNIEIQKYFPKIKNNILINGISEFNKYIVLSSNFGLLIYDKNKKTFSKLKFLTDRKKLLPDKEISFILKENDTTLWVGTNKSFLFKLKLAKANNGYLLAEKIFSYQNKIPAKYFGSKRVNHLMKDKKGSLWISTSNGLFELTEKDSLNMITEKDGLPNEIIYAALNDNLGNIWASTNKGIAKLSFENGKLNIKNYDASDGLQGNEFNQASCYKSSDGRLYFGGINGYSYFNPKDLKENPYPPNSVITRIKILNKEIPNMKNVISDKELTVDYSDKMLTFILASLEFTNPNKNKYAYKLEGFDDMWIYTGTNREATYTNLNPGNYKLKIKTSNDDEIWSDEISALSLIVKPPFWMTWWFVLFITLSIIILLFLLHKYRVKRLLEMERLRIKIASDLHDEVGPLLTQISLSADSINYESDISKIKKRSTIIRDKSREIGNSLSDVIWSIDARKDKFENLIDRMQDFTNSLPEEKGIEIQFHKNISDIGKTLKVDFRQNIFLIFKEAVNNAVKHSGGSLIIITLEYKKNEFIMKISDNGIGLDTEKTYKGNGLKNIKMRAEKISAEVEFITHNGFTIQLRTNYV